MPNKSCSICQTEFTCGATQPSGSCWCNNYPAIMPARFDQDCRCPSCLARAIAERIDGYIQSKSHDEMLALANQHKNNNALIEHIDYTIENGLYVLSQWHHLKRGRCCGNGCHHCPYPLQEDQRVNRNGSVALPSGVNTNSNG